MHTLSKYIGGHSDIIGGVLVGQRSSAGQKAILSPRTIWRHYGTHGILARSAWTANPGRKNAPARKNAGQVAEFLEGHRRIKKVNYPGLKSHPQHELIQSQQRGSCGLLSFELDGTMEQAKQFSQRLRLFHIGVSWGGLKVWWRCPYARKTCRAGRWLGGTPNISESTVGWRVQRI